MLVGSAVPPAGSTVSPTLSPGRSPEASTGVVRPAPAASSPAGRVPADPMSHSWYTFAAGNAGSRPY